jgi:Zn-dependent protease
VQALVWAALLKLAVIAPDNLFSVPLRLMSEAGIVVNLVFMFLNLLPILPLDGGRILASLLPSRAAWQYAKLEPLGLPLLVILLLTNVLSVVLEPLVGASDALIRAIVL